MWDHDERCELLPGGKYEGLDIPCHCAARHEGRVKAQREQEGK